MSLFFPLCPSVPLKFILNAQPTPALGQDPAGNSAQGLGMRAVWLLSLDQAWIMASSRIPWDP